VFGGKLTTYRKLAESAMAQLAPYFTQMRPSWTATASLPGGEDMTTPQALAEAIGSKFDWLPSEIARRWSTTYGSRTWRLLEGVQSLADLGEHLGGGLYTREVDYLCAVGMGNPAPGRALAPDQTRPVHHPTGTGQRATLPVQG